MSAYIMDSICFTSDFPFMGWKWTIQDPFPIHIYHNILWESKYQPHFSKISHGVVLHIYQFVFNEKCPRISAEGNNDLLSIGRWFGEESFPYVWVFSSLAQPHVFPLYVLDKILAREIAYQTVGNGLSKVMRERKKTMWHAFSFHCGVYSLYNFKHATKEMEEIQLMKFPTIPNGRYDPVDTAKNITTQAKIRQFTNEPNKFDDFFESTSNYA